MRFHPASLLVCLLLAGCARSGTGPGPSTSRSVLTVGSRSFELVTWTGTPNLSEIAVTESGRFIGLSFEGELFEIGDGGVTSLGVKAPVKVEGVDAFLCSDAARTAWIVTSDVSVIGTKYVAFDLCSGRLRSETKVKGHLRSELDLALLPDGDLIGWEEDFSLPSRLVRRSPDGSPVRTIELPGIPMMKCGPLRLGADGKTIIACPQAGEGYAVATGDAAGPLRVIARLPQVGISAVAQTGDASWLGVVDNWNRSVLYGLSTAGGDPVSTRKTEMRAWAVSAIDESHLMLVSDRIAIFEPSSGDFQTSATFPAPRFGRWVVSKGLACCAPNDNIVMRIRELK